MTRIYALLFAVALTLSACATAGPIALKCGLQDIAIAAADYSQIAADVHAKNWDDLAKIGEKIGWATLDCVLGDQVAQNPGVKANVDEFKRLKSVEFRSAGVRACNDFKMRGPLAPVASTIRGGGGSSVDRQAGGDVPGAAYLLRGGPEAGHQAHNLTSQVQFLAPQPFRYAGVNPGVALASCESTRWRHRAAVCVKRVAGGPFAGWLRDEAL